MSTRDSVLEALRAAGDAGVSGAALAGRLGVSRVAVGKHVHALRDVGYRIDAAPGRGYALRSVPDAPLPAEVRLHLRSGEWTHLTGGGVTGSTNVDAAALARAGAEHGTAVLASAQRAGRGRLGRSWASPVGGVYVSAVLRPPLAPAELAGLPLAVAWGVAAEMSERFPLAEPFSLKWPNDLVLGALGSGGLRKLGGVLLEISAEADRTTWVIAGVGVNVARGAEPVAGAGYLADVAEGGGGGAPGLAQTAAAVLDGMARGYELLATEGFSAVRQAIGGADALRGVQVRVRDIEGALVAAGVAEGIDDIGRLMVRDADGRVLALTAGDVTLAGCSE